MADENGNIVTTSVDDDDFYFDDNPDEVYWDRLIDEIIKGNVVPVIGAEMIVENCSNIHQEIINKLVKIFGIRGNINSFSELVYHKDYLNKYDKDYIYKVVNSYLGKKTLTPSNMLKKLLSCMQFPFIITTSFTPVVENVMKDIYGEIQTLIFKNDPIENGDIRDESDIRIPTVYYMFGKYCNAAHRYVLTDTDMLEFSSSWLSDSIEKKPVNLVSALSDKYLLMIGNNYSDWLFRFIWYSLRKDKMGRGMLAYNEVEDSFLNFLDRTNAFARKDPSDVINQIEARLGEKMKKNELIKFNKPEEKVDVIISYSRRDGELAEKLYNSLSSLGKKVWYDKKDLSNEMKTGGKKFLEEIFKAIDTALYFIPILSPNTIKEKGDYHVYRREWDAAITKAKGMGRRFIIPLTPKDFNYDEAAVDNYIKNIQPVFYDGNDWEKIAKDIIGVMNQQ